MHLFKSALIHPNMKFINSFDSKHQQVKTQLLKQWVHLHEIFVDCIKRSVLLLNVWREVTQTRCWKYPIPERETSTLTVLAVLELCFDMKLDTHIDASKVNDGDAAELIKVILEIFVHISEWTPLAFIMNK